MTRLFFLFLLLFSGNVLLAQEVKAILVQLSAEQNRIKYFKKAKHHMDAVKVSAEAKKIRNATIHDFTDNFSYCPVYYYIDTNIVFIKNRQFAGVLLDADGVPVKDPVVNSAGMDYVIVNYGFPEENTTISPDHKGLVIYNDEFKQIYFLRKSKADAAGNKFNPKYLYVSDKYDMEYKPFAAQLEKKIETVTDKMDNSLK